MLKCDVSVATLKSIPETAVRFAAVEEGALPKTVCTTACKTALTTPVVWTKDELTCLAEVDKGLKPDFIAEDAREFMRKAQFLSYKWCGADTAAEVKASDLAATGGKAATSHASIAALHPVAMAQIALLRYTERAQR